MLSSPNLGGLLASLTQGEWTPGEVATALAVPLVLYLVKIVVFPTVDPREPPVLRPKLPFIGHLVSLAREKNSMYDRLYKQYAMPICSLPMLHGYVYVINDPLLISAAMRNRNLSFDPFSLEFASGAMGMTKEHVEIFSRPGNMDEVNRVIHAALSGDNVYRMNVRALKDIAAELSSVPSGDEGLRVPDCATWLRNVIALATMTAMFGKNSPFTADDVPDFWEFDKGVGLLALGIAPTLLAPKSLAARARSQAKLTAYYEAHHDQADDVAAIIRDRAALERRHGIPDRELALIEYSMLFVSTTNTIPTLIWFFIHVFAHKDLAARIRAEVELVATVDTNPDTGRRTASIDISRLEKACPTLHATYRETLRKYSDVLGNRRVMADTTLRHPVTGREYLLKKGVNVQWAAQVTHGLDNVWGEGNDAFDPDRFVETSAVDEKKRRGAMIPFGGGRNLCPGRNFAQAENLGLVSAVALGFDVEGMEVPGATNAYMGTAVKRPEWGDVGPPIQLKRRPGWEDVTWEFKC